MPKSRITMWCSNSTPRYKSKRNEVIYNVRVKNILIEEENRGCSEDRAALIQNSKRCHPRCGLCKWHLGDLGITVVLHGDRAPLPVWPWKVIHCEMGRTGWFLREVEFSWPISVLHLSLASCTWGFLLAPWCLHSGAPGAEGWKYLGGYKCHLLSPAYHRLPLYRSRFQPRIHFIPVNGISVEAEASRRPDWCWLLMPKVRAGIQGNCLETGNSVQMPSQPLILRDTFGSGGCVDDVGRGYRWACPAIP